MNFMDNLAAMGYSLAWREATLWKALVGYMRVLGRVRDGETRRNRLATCTELARRVKKLCGETSWFRDEQDELEHSESQESQRSRRRQVRDNRRVESILFIPLTQESTLKKKLTELERNSTFRSKFKYV